MSTLHVGVMDPTVIRRFYLSPDIQVSTDGSWEEWGEPVNGGATHVVIQQEGVPAHDWLIDVAGLLDQMPQALVAMTHEQQKDIIASITEDDDWSEEIFHVRRKPRTTIDDI